MAAAAIKLEFNDDICRDDMQKRIQLHAGGNAMKLFITTEEKTENRRSRVRSITWGVGIQLFMLATMVLLSTLVSPAFAVTVDDDTPFFAGANGAPNIMFILDNSDSMQELPYLRQDGKTPLRPGINPKAVPPNSSNQDWPWRRGVKLNADNTIMEDANGNVVWDDLAFASTEMTIPQQATPWLPRLVPLPTDSMTSTADVNNTNAIMVLPKQDLVSPLPTIALSSFGVVTGNMIKNSGQPLRIYDSAPAPSWASNVDFTNGTNFNKYYQYRIVEVLSSTGHKQIRTISGVSTGSRYFTIEGGNLVYEADPVTYSFTILPDKASTRTYLPSSPYIYDASLDWNDDKLNADFILNYKYRRAKVYDDTGGEEYVTITDRSVSSRRFTYATPVSITNTYLPYDVVKERYAYAILDENPGKVTYQQTNTQYVYDGNLKWSSIDTSWVGKLLTATTGANPPETRKITGFDQTNKRWTVSAYLGSSNGFSVPCNFTTTYEIKDAPTDPSKIFDASLDWNSTALSTEFNLKYRYRLVKVESADPSEDPQIKTINGGGTATQHFFTIDTSAEAGGPLNYDPTKIPYKYTILTDGPGKVTRVATPATGDNFRYVTDADVDWATVAREFDTKWKNRAIIITGGTNNNETILRHIQGYDTNTLNKRWYVSTADAYPALCDRTTNYKIVGAADDTRLAFGGNHPASKLYQAKKALNLFLNDTSLKIPATTINGVTTPEKTAVNIGFATYLSAKVPRVTAKYYRKTVEVPERYCARYKTPQDASTDFYHPDSSTTFTTKTTWEDWKTAPRGETSWVTNQVHTDVTVGYQFDRLYHEGQCDQQIIHYTLASITPSPGGDGSLPDQKKFTVRSRVSYPQELGYWSAPERCENASATITSCDDLPAFYNYYGTLTPKIASGEPCYVCNHYDLIPSLYSETYRDTYGDYTKTNATPDTSKVPGYVNLTTLATPWLGFEGDTKNLTTPILGYEGNSWTIKDANFVDEDWQLLTTTLVDVATSYNTTTHLYNKVTLKPNMYDTSYFMYPGYETEDRPHGWSYKKASQNYIYATPQSWSGAEFPKYNSAASNNPSYDWLHRWPGYNGGWTWSTWRNDAQPTTNFPATVGDEMANTSGNDQTVFVNLPQYHETDTTHPSHNDDILGANLTKILNYVDLTRLPAPDLRAPSMDYTIAPYSSSIAPNAYSALQRETAPGIWQSSGTPLAATLENLQTYYSSYIEQDALTPTCRKNYVILLTDGLETGGGNAETAARNLYNLNVDSKHCPIETYVIGFGLDDDSKATLNAIAAAGSPPHVYPNDPAPRNAYFADDVETLVDILVTKITADILNKSFSRTTPVVTAYIPNQDLGLYTTRFEYPSWRGHLYGYNVDPTTINITGPATGWVSDCDDADSLPDGDAGCEMAKFGRGTVYTGIRNNATDNTYTRQEFEPALVDSVTDFKDLVNPADNHDIDGILPGGTVDDAKTVVNYTKNSGYDGGKYKGSRDPSWYLGDIYHSSTVVVGPPTFNPPAAPGAPAVDPYAGYAGFKTVAATRPTRIYVGANDGMVHAIKAEDGREDWAYIPNSVLGQLWKLGQGHKFTVDLPLRASDIYSPGGTDTTWPAIVPGTGTESTGWHTLIASGLRDGGYSLYALEVTDPAAFKPAWEMTDVNMGKTWSTPNFGRIKIDGVTTYVLIVGGGLEAATVANKGNYVYILDAGSGKILSKIAIGADSFNKVPSEILLVTEKNKTSPDYGYTIAGYFGDTSGDLYKLEDLNSASGWAPSARRLNNGDGKVFHKPTIATSKGGCIVTKEGVDYMINSNTTFIFYGTGDEETATNKTSVDYLYEIADPPLTPVIPGPDSLSEVWKVTLPAGEKMLTDPTNYLNVFYFITYNPAGGCDVGESFLWGLTPTKCGDIGNGAGLVYDKNGNSVGGPWRKISLGYGITSSPTPAGPKMIISVASGQGDDDTDANEDDDQRQQRTPTVNRLEYWREDFQ
ncbi:MAG: PilC/PilY family type IV pilus protein [Pseudomonadota bacterium]